MMDLVSRASLATRLQVNRKAVDTLIETGIIAEVVRAGRNVYVTEETARRIEATPFVDEDSIDFPYLIVKVNRAVDDTTGARRWQGWKAGIDAFHPDQMDGVRGFWQVRDAERYRRHLLIPTASGFVLTAYRIEDFDTYPGNFRRFDVSKPDPEIAKHFLLRRFPPRAGAFTELH